VIEELYDTFLTRVSESRHMPKDAIDAVAKGRVWTGQEAYERHLVDKLGGIREALQAAREAGGLANDAPIVELPRPQKTLVETALELAGIDVRAPSPLDALPTELRDVARAIGPLAVHAGEGPLARLEWVSVDDTSGADPE
jgi:protease-4